MSKLYVGVDWHKRTSTWVAIDEHQEVVYQHVFPCTPQAVETAIATLPAAPQDTMLAVEPVCGWRWMTSQVAAAGITTKIANPKQLRLIADTAKKNDRQDAKTLAELLQLNYLPEAYKAPETVQALRALVRQRGFLIHQQTAIKCRIHGVCTALGSSDTPLHAADRRILQTGDNAILRELFVLLSILEEHIKVIEQQITRSFPDTTVYRLLLSLPGVGPVTAASIYAEVGDFNRFSSAAALISYAGLYPKEHSSGERQRYGHLSKQGSRLLRYSIVEAAMRVRDKVGSQRLYSHYTAAVQLRHKTPKQARIILAHKLLTIAWYIVRRGIAYDDSAVKPARREMTSGVPSVA